MGKASNIARGGSGDGAITYSIDNTNVATINSTSGELTLKSAGIAKVKATKAADANYTTISNSYILTVNAEPSIKFEFAKSQITIKYKADLTIDTNLIVKNIDKGTIRFNSDKSSVATIDNGILSIQGVGTATITATRSADSNNEELTVAFLLTVIKGDQAPLVFDKSFVNVGYRDNRKENNAAQGGTGNGGNHLQH